EPAAETPEKSAVSTFGMDVRNRCGEVDLGLAFENVKRRGAVFTFAADDVAGAKSAAHDCVPVQLQERAGNSLEVGKLEQILNLSRLAAQFRLHHELVGKRARGAGHHAFATRNARRIPHGSVE